MTNSISTYCGIPSNVGTLFNEIIIPPCCITSRFYVNDEGLFTIYFEGYHYRSLDYGALVEFVKEKAESLGTFDVIPF